jgi:hypothetical protein
LRAIHLELEAGLPEWMEAIEKRSKTGGATAPA